MRRIYFAFVVLLCITSQSAYAQIHTIHQQAFNISQKWVPVRENSQIPYPGKNSNNSGKEFENFRDVNRPDHVYTHLRNRYENNNDDKAAGSGWEKMPGPYGGAVRQFYKFQNKLYATTDREIFVYENSVWKSLDFEKILCNTVSTMYRYPSGRILVASDWGLYYTDNEGKLWNRLALGDWDRQTNVIQIYNAPDGDLYLGTTKGLYIAKDGNFNYTTHTLGNRTVLSVTTDNNGNIWVTTGTGVLEAKNGVLDWQTMDLDQNAYRKIIVDSANTIYTFSRTQVLKSTDMGSSWWVIEGPFFEDITLDSNQKLIITSSHQIFGADQQGIQWASRRFNQYLLTSYDSDKNGLLIGTLGPGAYKYDRKADVLVYFNQGLSASTIRGLVSMVNGDLIACTDNDSLYISEDKGMSWRPIYAAWSRYMKSSGSGAVYVAAGGGIIRSTDFGKTWKKLNLDVRPYYINAFDVSDDDQIICAGTSTGEVYVSFDSGKHFQMIKKSNDTFVEAIVIINRDTYVVADDSLYYTNDGGEKLSVVDDSLLNGAKDFAIDDLGYVYLSNYSGIYRSPNGIDWYPVTNKLTNIQYLRTDQYSNIYAASSNGSVYSSTNHGKNWSIVADNIPYTFFWSFAFSTDGYIFEGSQDKGLYRTKIELKQRGKITANTVSRNFPNPFNSTTQIEYNVADRSFVRLTIYDLLGRKVQTLISEFKNQGEYLISWHPINCASGIYLYRIQIGSDIQTGKMIYLK